MSSLVWMMIIVLALTLLGTLALAFVTIKYYWGERGSPPATGEQRKLQQAEELRMRAKQIEYASTHPVTPRKPEFWDNSKASGPKQEP